MNGVRLVCDTKFVFVIRAFIIGAATSVEGAVAVETVFAVSTIR